MAWCENSSVLLSSLYAQIGILWITHSSIQLITIALQRNTGVALRDQNSWNEMMEMWRGNENVKVCGWMTRTHTHKERESTRIKIRARNRSSWKFLPRIIITHLHRKERTWMDEEVEAVNNRVEEEEEEEEEVFQESCSVFEVSGTNYMKKNQIYELEERNSHKWPRRFNDMKITNIQLKIRKLAEMSHLYSSYYICTSLRKKCEQLYTTSYSWTLLHWLCKVKCKKSFCDWLF